MCTECVYAREKADVPLKIPSFLPLSECEHTFRAARRKGAFTRKTQTQASSQGEMKHARRKRMEKRYQIIILGKFRFDSASHRIGWIEGKQKSSLKANLWSKKSFASQKNKSSIIIKLLSRTRTFIQNPFPTSLIPWTASSIAASEATFFGRSRRILRVHFFRKLFSATHWTNHPPHHH